MKNMETIFMNTGNSKISEPHRFKFDLTDKLNLKNPQKNMALANLSIYYTWKNIKSEYSNNKFKISAPIGMILSIYLMVLILLQMFRTTLTENPPVQIYPNKVKNRIVFKIKTGDKLELLTPKTMKLFRSPKKDIDKDKDGEIVRKLESVEIVLVHCNLVKSDYQHTSKVLYSFVPNKQFEQFINISPHSLTMMNTANTKFSFVKVWFTDQASKALEIEDNSYWVDIIKMRYSTEPRFRKYIKGYGFLSFAKKFGDKYG